MKADLILVLLVASATQKTDTMRSKPTSQLYSDGWERTFGQDPEESAWDLPMPPKNQLN